MSISCAEIAKSPTNRRKEREKNLQKEPTTVLNDTFFSLYRILKSVICYWLWGQVLQCSPFPICQ